MQPAILRQILAADRGQLIAIVCSASPFSPTPGQSKNAGKSIGAPITGVGFAGASAGWFR